MEISHLIPRNRQAVPICRHIWSGLPWTWVPPAPSTSLRVQAAPPRSAQQPAGAPHLPRGAARVPAARGCLVLARAGQDVCALCLRYREGSFCGFWQSLPPHPILQALCQVPPSLVTLPHLARRFSLLPCRLHSNDQ